MNLDQVVYLLGVYVTKMHLEQDRADSLAKDNEKLKSDVLKLQNLLAESQGRDEPT